MRNVVYIDTLMYSFFLQCTFMETDDKHNKENDESERRALDDEAWSDSQLSLYLLNIR